MILIIILWIIICIYLAVKWRNIIRIITMWKPERIYEEDLYIKEEKKISIWVNRIRKIMSLRKLKNPSSCETYYLKHNLKRMMKEYAQRRLYPLFQRHKMLYKPREMTKLLYTGKHPQYPLIKENPQLQERRFERLGYRRFLWAMMNKIWWVRNHAPVGQKIGFNESHRIDYVYNYTKKYNKMERLRNQRRPYLRPHKIRQRVNPFFSLYGNEGWKKLKQIEQQIGMNEPKQRKKSIIPNVGREILEMLRKM